MPDERIQIGVAGVGGYAGVIVDLIQRCGANCQPPVNLKAVCEPDPTAHTQRIESLSKTGVNVLKNFESLLAEPIDAVWLPLPIHLHRTFTEAALAAGKAVICEKPAAGCVQDVDAMIAARQRFNLPVAVGFQHIYHPATLALKRRLRAGAIGTIKNAVISACWPRPVSYYTRNKWAGAIERDGTWILDCPANNALAHELALAMLFMGGDPDTQDATTTPLDSMAQVQHVEAELYRANAIENNDTMSLRLHLPDGGRILLLMTHASESATDAVITLHGENGTARYTRDQWQLSPASGEPEQMAIDDPHSHMVERFAKLVRNVDDSDRLIATLELARKQVAVINAAAEITPVRTVPASAVCEKSLGDDSICVIRGIDEVIARCTADRLMLHESKQFDWTRPAGQSVSGTIGRRFAGPARGNK